MSESPKRRWTYSLRTLFAAMTVFSTSLAFSVFAASQKPLESPAWGPLHMAFDGSPENRLEGWAFAFAFEVIVLFFVLRPRPWSACLVVTGMIVWLLLGIIGAGINV